MAAAEQYSSYDASNPSTPAEVLALIAEHRPELRALVAANPSTSEPTAQWLAGLGDVAVDAALRRRAGAGAGLTTGSVDSSAQWQQPDAGPQAAYGQPAGFQPGFPGQPSDFAHPSAAYGQPAAHGQQPGGFGQQPGAFGQPGATGQHQAFGQQPGAYGPGYGAASGQEQSYPGAQAAYGYQSPQVGPWTTAQPAKSGSAVGWIIGGAVVVVVAIVAVIIGLTAALGPIVSDDANAYGDDPALDALWDSCEGGDAQACDDLFMDSPLASEYEDFGASCGGRFPGTDQYCVDLM